MSRMLGLWMIVIGASLSLFVVAIASWWAWQELAAIPSIQSHYLEGLFAYAFLIGPPMAIVGSFMWARRAASARILTISGCGLFVCSLAVLILTGVVFGPPNVHSTTMPVAFVCSAAILISMIFGCFALVRADGARDRKSEPRS